MLLPSSSNYLVHIGGDATFRESAMSLQSRPVSNLQDSRSSKGMLRTDPSAGFIPSTGLSRNVDLKVPDEILKDGKTTEEGNLSWIPSNRVLKTDIAQVPDQC
jgi:hypothetical protein